MALANSSNIVFLMVSAAAMASKYLSRSVDDLDKYFDAIAAADTTENTMLEELARANAAVLCGQPH